MIAFLVPSELDQYETDRVDGPQGSSELAIKANVRTRDGNQCRDCGKTSEQHVEETGRELDVHRLIPGSPYNEVWCVTLCRKCHGKKSKDVLDAFRTDDLRFVMFNMYHQEDVDLWASLRSAAFGAGTDVGDFIASILKVAVAGRTQHQRADLFVCNDGLW